ncbi:MAG: hypothetical protein ABIY71_05315, partial [Flavobacteriales bacterium]
MDTKRYASSPNFENGKFHNLLPTSMAMSAKDMAKTIAGFIAGGEDRAPKHKIHVLHPDTGLITAPYGSTRVVWYGHSAFLLQIDGKN